MEFIVLTKEDLDQFRRELIEEISRLVNPDIPRYSRKIKSKEVRELMKISPGKLQNLRITGQLGFAKVGGTYYYDYHEVIKLLES